MRPALLTLILVAAASFAGQILWGDQILWGT
jgi:hypothetical protein